MTCAYPMRSFSWCLTLVVLPLLAACSKPSVRVLRFPDGSRELTCDFGLSECIAQVDYYCKGSSFEVLYAHDKQHTYGTPGAEVESRTSRAVVHCLGLHDKPLAPAGAPIVAARPLPPAKLPAPARSAAPAPARACVPGATQACVGAAACSGGQSCLPDGSGFGACDCGVANASAPATSAPSGPR